LCCHSAHRRQCRKPRKTPPGKAAAQASALAVLLARTGAGKEAIITFLDSESYEDAVRNAVSLGGDSHTLACITGGVAEAFYGGIPEEIRTEVEARLPGDLREITRCFLKVYR